MLTILVYLFVAAIILLTIKSPLFGIWGYYFLAFFQVEELPLITGVAGKRFSMIIIAVTTLRTIVWIFQKNARFPKSYQSLFVLILITHIYLSVFLVGSDMWKVERYRNMAIIFFIASAIVIDKNWLKYIILAYGLALICDALYAHMIYYRYQWLLDWATKDGLAGNSIFVDRNDFAQGLGCAIPCMYYYGTTLKKWYWKYACWLSIPLLTHAVFLTESRGGLLGLAAVFGMIVLRSRRPFLYGVIGLVLGGIFVALFAGETLRKRAKTSVNEDPSALSRIHSWQVGLKMMRQNLVMGIGLERYVDKFYDYSDWQPRYDNEGKLVEDFEYEAHRAHVAHNRYIQRGAESGLLILILDLLIIIITLFQLRRVRRRLDPAMYPDHVTIANTIEASMICYLVTSFFLSQEEFEWFYVMLMMTAVLYRNYQQIISSKSALSPD